MFISPMLLQKTDQPFESSDYITELKLDGIRLIYTVDLSGKVRLYTRHNNEVTSKFPELLSLDIPPGTTLDGELIVTDTNGKPDFESMMSRFQSRRSNTPVSFVVFDILSFEGKSVTSLPLIERKALLNEVIPEDGNTISKVQFIEGNGPAYFDLVKTQELEGIVLKRKDSRYEVGKRSQSWLKCINYQFAEVFVSGFRKSKFGWLLTDEDGKYLGVMELGIPANERAKVYNAEVATETEYYVYLAKPIKCRVKYRNLTRAKLLRLPSLVSL